MQVPRALGVAVTLQPDGFEPHGVYQNRADYLFRSNGALVTPQSPPPALPG